MNIGRERKYLDIRDFVDEAFSAITTPLYNYLQAG